MIQDIRWFSLTLSTDPDGVLWKRGVEDYGNEFVSSETWHQIRHRREKVQWSKLVRFSQGVLRYAFITWLAIRDRLSTEHRTSIWGQTQCCLYCGEPDETRDHLYFACPYTYILWLKVAGSLFGLDLTRTGTSPWLVCWLVRMIALPSSFWDLSYRSQSISYGTSVMREGTKTQQSQLSSLQS